MSASSSSSSSIGALTELAFWVPRPDVVFRSFVHRLDEGSNTDLTRWIRSDIPDQQENLSPIQILANINVLELSYEDVRRLGLNGKVIHFQRYDEASKLWIHKVSYRLVLKNTEAGQLCILDRSKLSMDQQALLAEHVLKHRYGLRTKLIPKEEVQSKALQAWQRDHDQRATVVPTIPLALGLYTIAKDTPTITEPWARQLGILDEAEEDKTFIDGLTQFLIIDSNALPAETTFLPSLHRDLMRDPRATFGTPFVPGLADDVYQLWFRGHAPRRNQFIATVGQPGAIPVPIKQPGVYTLWAMQYDDPRYHTDPKNGLMVRWQLLQVMTVEGPEYTEETVITVRREHELRIDHIFELPKNALMNRNFIEWEYRPLDGYIWKSYQGEMRRDPTEEMNEYALQGVYKASSPILDEPTLRVLFTAHPSLGGNAVSIKDMVTQWRKDLEIIKTNLYTTSMPIPVVNQLDDKTELVKHVQSITLMGYYLDVLSDPLFVRDLVSTTNWAQVQNGMNVFLTDIKTRNNSIITSLATEAGILVKLEPAVFIEALKIQATRYAPTFLPFVLSLIHEGGDSSQSAFLKAIKAQYRVFLGLEEAIVYGIQRAHPNDQNIQLAQREVAEKWTNNNIITIKNQNQAEQQGQRIRQMAPESSVVQSPSPSSSSSSTLPPRGSGNLVFVMPPTEGRPLKDTGLRSTLIQAHYRPRLDVDRGLSNRNIEDWERTLALLQLHLHQEVGISKALVPPYLPIRRYQVVVRAAVRGIDANTHQPYDVVHPEWGQSRWFDSGDVATAPADSRVTHASPKTREILAMIQHRIAKAGGLTDVPLYPLLAQVVDQLNKTNGHESALFLSLQTALLELTMLIQTLSGAILKEERGRLPNIIRMTRNQNDHSQAALFDVLHQQSLPSLERMTRAYDMVQFIPDLSFLGIRKTDPGPLRANPTEGRLRDQGAPSPDGVWIGMPSSWHGGPQLYSVLDQVLERLQLIKLSQDEGENPTRIEAQAKVLAKEPLRFSSLYVSLEAEAVVARHHTTLRVTEPSGLVHSRDGTRFQLPFPTVMMH